MSALAGKRVLVTRPRHQAASLAALLRQAGATPLLLPLIEIVPPAESATRPDRCNSPSAKSWP